MAEKGVASPPATPARIREQARSHASDRFRPPPSAPLLKPWTLPARGLAVFHGPAETARLSHYFLPRLLQQGQRVLMLDGANCADPRLLERLARQRGVPFADFNRQIEIARAFTCFQLTEMIARLPQFLADFPAQALIVTAFPELYYDEDVQDWNARVAFERALAGLRRWSAQQVGGRWQVVGGESSTSRLPPPICRSTHGADATPLTIAVFSSAATFVPSPVRQRFFEKTCAAASEIWKFEVDADQHLKLVCTQSTLRLGEVTSESKSRQLTVNS
jgi:hypothetical protein